MGREIMDVLKDETFMEGGHGEVIAIRLWEVEVMLEMKMIEADYLNIPKKERARLLVGHKLADWIGGMDLQVFRRDMDRKKK